MTSVGVDAMSVLTQAAHTAGTRALAKLVEDKRVLVCVGSGGVGKTTCAATLGLAAACRGKKTLVITIDPARRLANALGMSTLSHDPQRIDDATLRAAGADPKAPLFAMMLDLKAAWDDMLRRTAPDEETCNKILGNRFYEALSRDLPGAHEFIACEALHHLASSGAWDLVVLDTPPTQNALDFLEAPARILAVLDNDAFRFFATRKNTLGLRFLDGASGRAQSVLARFAGSQILEELGEFIVLLRDLYDPLTQRTKEFVALLRGAATRFLVVSAPHPSALSEARFFLDELARRDLALGAVIVNRVTPSPGDALDALADTQWEERLHTVGIDDKDAAALVAVLDEAVRQQALLARHDRALVDETFGAARAGDVPIVEVPRMSDAVHDAARLLEIGRWLVGP